MLTKVWNGKLVVFVRAAFEIYGIIKTLGALGGSALLSVLVPNIIELFMGLSVFEKTVVGVGVFFLSLAVILALLKPVIQQRVSIASELERVSAELRDLQQERDRIQQEKNQLQSTLMAIQDRDASESRKRIGYRHKGGTGRVNNARIRNQDIGIDAEDADIEAKDLNIE